MIFNKKFFTGVIEYLNQFHLQWGASYLRPTDAGCDTDATSCHKVAVHARSLFDLNSRLMAGWYMLEMQIKSPTVRVQACAYLVGTRKDRNTQRYGFSLQAGRMCKRLIYLADGGQLRVNLELGQSDFELQHFRLVRVTQSFARSRVLRKLEAMHPRYKPRQRSHVGKRNVINLTNAADLLPLWSDYCALFEETAEIVTYPEWICKFDTVTNAERAVMSGCVDQFACKPVISIVMRVCNPKSAWLEQTIESVLQQHYPHWELCIVDVASTDPATRLTLERFAQSDKRIKIAFRDQNGPMSTALASDSALMLAQGEWVALLDQDDMLAEQTLFWVVDAINRQPESRLIYTDEDKIDEMGVRSEPYFKCNWNPDLFYSQNMISHLGVYHAALVREVGGFRAGLGGAQDYDLALRCIERIAPEQIHHVPRVLYHCRRIRARSTAYDLESKSYATIAGESALNEHLERLGVDAMAESVGHGYRVRYALPEVLPLVSLIIPTRNGLKLIQQCLESILALTSYGNYEILVVDNGSDEPAVLRYLRGLASEPRIRVMREDRPFNYSALNNVAVKSVRGEIVGLINNDIEVINSDWLSEMVSHALRPEVGAVGARLWYSDDTIQHAGMVLGMHGIAGHVHRFLPKGDTGYRGRAALIQSFSAVTGACLLVRKSIYEAVGGLNETDLQIACNDVDFCLRVREAGYRNIWTPYAELYHHESATRGLEDTPEKHARAVKEVAYMRQRWGKELQDDPAYSPNLTLDAEDFSLAWPPRVDGFLYI